MLFIAVDDLRVAPGCYGDPLKLTPNLDRFATGARVFNRAYTMQALTKYYSDLTDPAAYRRETWQRIQPPATFECLAYFAVRPLNRFAIFEPRMPRIRRMERSLLLVPRSSGFP